MLIFSCNFFNKTLIKLIKLSFIFSCNFFNKILIVLTKSLLYSFDREKLLYFSKKKISFYLKSGLLTNKIIVRDNWKRFALSKNKTKEKEKFKKSKKSKAKAKIEKETISK